jgi:hypothetical protein
MGHLPTPANGTAIDVSYVSDIVTEINRLNDDLGNRGRQSRIVDSISTSVPKMKIPTSQLSIVTGRKEITTDNNTATNDVVNGTFFFNQNFLYEPVVTATPTTDTGGIKNNTLGVSVVITKTNLNSVNFSVIFNSDNVKTKIAVNFIAIGVSAAQVS